MNSGWCEMMNQVSVIGKAGNSHKWGYVSQAEPLSTVLTQREVISVLARLQGCYLTIAQLMYGLGLHVNECLKFRVQDISFSKKEIFICGAQGQKGRTVILPNSVVAGLQNAIEQSRYLFDFDMMNNNWLSLPTALGKEPSCLNKTFGPRYVFNDKDISTDPMSGRQERHHLSAKSVQRAIKYAAQQANVDKYVSCYTLRRSFAIHLLESGYDIRTVQEILGHANVQVTIEYTNVLNSGRQDAVNL